MAAQKNLNIVLVTCQQSIIVKGLENKIKELGYTVFTIEDKFSEVEIYQHKADMFIYYLPVDVFDDPVALREHNIVKNLSIMCEKKLILIGEKRNHESYGIEVPAIASRIWISRPIDMGLLEDAIEKVFEAKEEDNTKRSILIVDDDPAYAKMVREWVKDYYNINIVTAGMQAIKYLTKKKVDLILLDYEMPVVDGPQVLEMLRSDPEMADIPVVFLTGIGTRESIERVMSLKPSGYVLKTTTREELINKLRNLFVKM